MKEIQLTRGFTTQVDDEDFEWLNQWKWYYFKTNRNSYACRSKKIPKTRSSERIYMHRIILKANSDQECDHSDNNGLNNQKYNIRLCSHQNNMLNCRKRKGTTSKYFGVCYYPSRDKFYAYITHNGKRTYLGWHDTEMGAALAYNKKAIELHGDFAKQNNFI